MFSPPREAKAAFTDTDISTLAAIYWWGEMKSMRHLRNACQCHLGLSWEILFRKNGGRKRRITGSSRQTWKTAVRPSFDKCTYTVLCLCVRSNCGQRRSLQLTANIRKYIQLAVLFYIVKQLRIQKAGDGNASHPQQFLAHGKFRQSLAYLI